MKLFLIWAAAVVIPMGLRLHGRRFEAFPSFKMAVSIWPIAGLAMCGSLMLPTGWVAAALTFPAVVTGGILAWAALQRMLQIGWHVGRRHWADSFSLGSLLVVALFVLSDRLDYQPFAFDSVIIFLTAIHFSYAGFVLPLVAAEVCDRQPNRRLSGVVTFGVVVGVAALALGIVATQLGFGWTLELVSSLWLAVFGATVGILMLSNWKKSRLLSFAGLCLIGGVTLAALYALRPIYPLGILDIPNMRAMHGTLQAIGFSTLALFALQQR